MQDSTSSEVTSEDRFRLLVEAVKDCAIFLLDPQGHVATWNVGAERIKGYRAEEILGRHISVFYIPEDARAGKADDFLKVASAEGRAENEGWRIRMDGSRFWADVVITSLRDDRGTLRGFSVVTRDMTVRRRDEEALRQLSERLLQLQDEERRRVARELHDGTAQNLAALTLNLTMLSESAEVSKNPKIGRILSVCRDLAERSLEEIRAITFLLHPPMLEEVGLVETLRWYIEGFAERTKIKIELDVPPELGNLPSELATALFRIVQECLANVHRHSGSRSAEVCLVKDSDIISLNVRDYGKGLIPSARNPQISVPAHPGVGTLSMRERVRLLDGKFQIESANPGTRVLVTIPLRPNSDDPSLSSTASR